MGGASEKELSDFVLSKRRLRQCGKKGDCPSMQRKAHRYPHRTGEKKGGKSNLGSGVKDRPADLKRTAFPGCAGRKRRN